MRPTHVPDGRARGNGHAPSGPRDGRSEEPDPLLEALGAARTLVDASTPEAAVRAATQACFQHVRRPVAAWLWKGGPSTLELTSVRGFGSRGRQVLRREMAVLPRWGTLPARGRREALRRFRTIIGSARVEAIDSGQAVLLAGGTAAASGEFLGLLGSVLEKTLDRLDEVVEARRRNEQLDLGIAWTAHEIRGPLLGAKWSVHSVLQGRADLGERREMLHGIERDLGQLATMVDELLRWSVGSGSLRKRKTNLTRLVRDAVRSCSLEAGQDRIEVRAPDRVVVRAHARHLRGALANVIRNALAYSPADGPVTVRVRGGRSAATVSVSDRGPGVEEDEREIIFDPFVRGTSVGGSRQHRGLGLFIAKRVIEAHGGKIWVEPGGRGTTISMTVPVPEPGRLACAS